MAGIHFKKKLIHQCTIQRTTPVQSSSGEPLDSWATVGTVDCRYVRKKQRVAQESIGFMTLLEDILLMNDSEDVIEEDRIINIVKKSDGSSVDSGPFTIEALLQRNTSDGHHLSLQLERVE